jgi:hypothetical protein
MYCSTCGAFLPEGRSACSECGTPAEARPTTRRENAPHGRAAARRYGSEDGRWLAERDVGVCPRCGYRGEGISYFSKGTHAAALIGVTVLTAGAMGAGGLIYYLIRREHLGCPRCGKGWGRHGELSLAPTAGMAERATAARVPAVSRERSSRGMAVFLFLLAAILFTVSLVQAELAPFVIGGFAAAGGVVFQRRANEQRERRRLALLEELQLPVLRLAREHGGRLTVTEVAAGLGWTLPRAEKVLNSLEDGLRVNSEVTREGVIVYEFWELIHTPKELPGSGREYRDREDEGGGTI